MLFIKRHKIQNSGPQQEEYAIYDTSVLSQYVAYDPEDSVSTRIDYIKNNNFQSIYTYIPQFFSGTDDVNREFIRANYSGPTVYPVSYQWSLIEICFAPYSGYPNDGYYESYMSLREGSSINLDLYHNDNYNCIYIDLGYEDSNQDYTSVTAGYFNPHYDGTRVLCTLFLIFIEDKVRMYLGVNDGFDQYDSYIRTINNNVAYISENTIYDSELKDAKTIASLDLYPYIGEAKTLYQDSLNTRARVYSVRKFSGMGNLADNSLDRTFAQHFEVDKQLFLRDAITNHRGN